MIDPSSLISLYQGSKTERDPAEEEPVQLRDDVPGKSFSSECLDKCIDMYGGLDNFLSHQSISLGHAFSMDDFLDSLVDMGFDKGFNIRPEFASEFLEIRETGVYGKGVYALKPVSAGTVVLRLGGKLSETCPRHGYVWNLCGDVTKKRKCYLVQDPTCGGIGSLVNHSCSSNCTVVRWKTTYEFVIAVLSQRDIRIGEEVTVDYGRDYIKKFLGGACLCDFCTRRKEMKKGNEKRRPIVPQSTTKRRPLSGTKCA